MKKYATKGRYETPKVIFRRAKGRKASETVPNQSLSIQEILRRFTKGLPIGDNNQVPVYIDQDEDNAIDLEKLAKADFGEKAAYADMLKQRHAAISEEVERQNEQAAADEKRSAEEAKQAKQDAKPNEQAGGKPASVA